MEVEGSNKRAKTTSSIPAFFKKTIEQRVNEVCSQAQLSEDEKKLLGTDNGLSLDVANAMVENVVGTLPLPYAVATNFLINGEEVLVPMVVEEPSVVAAASYGAKLCRSSGGFKANAPAAPVMIGQVLIVSLKESHEKIKTLIEEHEEKLINTANEYHPSLKKRGGGVIRVEPRIIETKRGKMLVVHFHVDVRDSMGANAVTIICEKMSLVLEQLTGGVARMKILSNLCPERVFVSEAIWTRESLQESVSSVEGLTGDAVVEAMLDASAFAEADPFRACTHNKGIMNGIDSVALATLNDTRAIESGAHCFASHFGKYSPLTIYEKTPEGHLKGTIRVPLALGTRGGATQSHPLGPLNLKIMGVETSDQLGNIMCSVGLAQNFAALRALVTEGLSKGHMRLHAKNTAIAVGAKGDLIFKVAERIFEEKKITSERAAQVLKELSSS